MYETCWTPRQGPQGTEGTAYRSGVHQKPGKGAAMKNEMVGTPASNMQGHVGPRATRWRQRPSHRQKTKARQGLPAAGARLHGEASNERMPRINEAPPDVGHALTFTCDGLCPMLQHHARTAVNQARIETKCVAGKEARRLL